MKKNTIRFVLCIIFLVTAIGWYFLPINLNTIVSKEVQSSTVEKASITVFSSAYVQETYEINDKVIIDNLIEIFDDVDARRTVSPPEVFKPSLYNTYYIHLVSRDKIVRVDFMDKNYLIVDNHTYKIVNEPNLMQIYDVVNSIK